MTRIWEVTNMRHCATGPGISRIVTGVRAALLLALSLSGSANASEFSLRVDGLACPFCSFGVEKKLLKVPGVEELDVLLDGGKVAVLNLRMAGIPETRLLGPVLEAISEPFLTVSGLPNVGWIFMGLVLILVVVFEPLGLYGLWLRTKKYWMTWPF